MPTKLGNSRPIERITLRRQNATSYMIWSTTIRETLTAPRAQPNGLPERETSQRLNGAGSHPDLSAELDESQAKMPSGASSVQALRAEVKPISIAGYPETISPETHPALYKQLLRLKELGGTFQSDGHLIYHTATDGTKRYFGGDGIAVLPNGDMEVPNLGGSPAVIMAPVDSPIYKLVTDLQANGQDIELSVCGKTVVINKTDPILGTRGYVIDGSTQPPTTVASEHRVYIVPASEAAGKPLVVIEEQTSREEFKRFLDIYYSYEALKNTPQGLSGIRPDGVSFTVGKDGLLHGADNSLFFPLGKGLGQFVINRENPSEFEQAILKASKNGAKIEWSSSGFNSLDFNLTVRIQSKDGTAEFLQTRCFEGKPQEAKVVTPFKIFDPKHPDQYLVIDPVRNPAAWRLLSKMSNSTLLGVQVSGDPQNGLWVCQGGVGFMIYADGTIDMGEGPHPDR